MLDIFRQRHRFSIAMHHQPSDKTFAKLNKLHAKRLFTCPLKIRNLKFSTPRFPLKDAICVLDQNQSGPTRQVTAQNGVLKISRFRYPVGYRNRLEETSVQQPVHAMWNNVPIVLEDTPVTTRLTRRLTGGLFSYALCSMGEAEDQQWLTKRCHEIKNHPLFSRVTRWLHRLSRDY